MKYTVKVFNEFSQFAYDVKDLSLERALDWIKILYVNTEFRTEQFKGFVQLHKQK